MGQVDSDPQKGRIHPGSCARIRQGLSHKHGLICLGGAELGGYFCPSPSTQDAGASWGKDPMGLCLLVSKGRPIGARIPGSRCSIEGKGGAFCTSPTIPLTKPPQSTREEGKLPLPPVTEHLQAEHLPSQGCYSLGDCIMERLYNGACH